MSSKKLNNQPHKEFYSGDLAETVFKENQLAGFDALWNLEAPWFETPNERRSGISGVVTWDLIGPQGEKWPVFIKRQQNHNTRSFMHPIKGVPTFFREQKNVARLIDIGVSTIDILYYGEQSAPEGTKAILVSRALEGYVSLDDWFNSPLEKSELEVQAVLEQVVAAIKPMHQHGFRHGSLYGKHIFLRFRSPDEITSEDIPIVDLRLIDLEKGRSGLFKNKLVTKDLSQLLRRSAPSFRSLAPKLLSLYFGADKQQYWSAKLEKRERERSK